jgi:hypothetical protein
MKILDFFLFLWVIFVLLDPDPDPDPKPWKKPTSLIFICGRLAGSSVQN